MAETMMVAELFSVLVDWAVASGAERIDLRDTPWEGETPEWQVTVHTKPFQVDGVDVDAMTFLLRHKTALIGMALVSPSGGVCMGPSEAELIAHFRDQMPGDAG